MKGLIMLIGFVVLVTFPYYVGRTQAERKPTDNHRDLARWADRLLQTDELMPVLTTDDRREGQELVRDFYSNTTNKKEA